MIVFYLPVAKWRHMKNHEIILHNCQSVPERRTIWTSRPKYFQSRQVGNDLPANITLKRHSTNFPYQTGPFLSSHPTDKSPKLWVYPLNFENPIRASIRMLSIISTIQSFGDNNLLYLSIIIRTNRRFVKRGEYLLLFCNIVKYDWYFLF